MWPVVETLKAVLSTMSVDRMPGRIGGVRRERAPVVWVTDEEEEAAVGQMALFNDRLLLDGVSKGRRVISRDFALSDLEAVVVTRRANPTLHLRFRHDGWLRVSGFSTVFVLQLAQLLVELSTT